MIQSWFYGFEITLTIYMPYILMLNVHFLI